MRALEGENWRHMIFLVLVADSIHLKPTGRDDTNCYTVVQGDLMRFVHHNCWYHGEVINCSGRQCMNLTQFCKYPSLIEGMEHYGWLMWVLFKADGARVLTRGVDELGASWEIVRNTSWEAPGVEERPRFISFMNAIWSP